MVVDIRSRQWWESDVWPWTRTHAGGSGERLRPGAPPGPTAAHPSGPRSSDCPQVCLGAHVSLIARLFQASSSQAFFGVRPTRRPSPLAGSCRVSPWTSESPMQMWVLRQHRQHMPAPSCRAHSGSSTAWPDRYWMLRTSQWALSRFPWSVSLYVTAAGFVVVAYPGHGFVSSRPTLNTSGRNSGRSPCSSVASAGRGDIRRSRYSTAESLGTQATVNVVLVQLPHPWVGTEPGLEGGPRQLTRWSFAKDAAPRCAGGLGVQPTASQAEAAWAPASGSNLSLLLRLVGEPSTVRRRTWHKKAGRRPRHRAARPAGPGISTGPRPRRDPTPGNVCGWE